MPDKEQTTPSPIEFALVGITTDQYASFMDRFDKAAPIETKPNLRIASDKASRAIGIFVRVDHLQNSEPVLVLEVGTHFQFTPEGWAALRDGDKLRLPRALAAHLGFLAMGTLRGVQYEKTLGLDCGRLILPLINLEDALTEDIVL